MVGILVPILISLGAFVMIIFIRKYENAEKLRMIEQGMDPNLNRPKRSAGGLKFALVAIGIGIGLLVGNFLDSSGILYEDVAYFSMGLVFGGLGLLIGYMIQMKQIREEEELERKGQ